MEGAPAFSLGSSRGHRTCTCAKGEYSVLKTSPLAVSRDEIEQILRQQHRYCSTRKNYSNWRPHRVPAAAIPSNIWIRFTRSYCWISFKHNIIESITYNYAIKYCQRYKKSCSLHCFKKDRHNCFGVVFFFILYVFRTKTRPGKELKRQFVEKESESKPGKKERKQERSIELEFKKTPTTTY